MYNKLKAFVRFDGSGRIVPSSLILQKSKPKVGNWKEVQSDECCNFNTTTTTTTNALSTSTTTTTICTRPTELINVLFFNTYSYYSQPSIDFTSTESSACLAASYKNDSGISYGGPTNQLVNFAVGNIVYSGTTLTNCQVIPDGYYITDIATNQITHVLSGIIQSITNCPI